MASEQGKSGVAKAGPRAGAELEAHIDWLRRALRAHPDIRFPLLAKKLLEETGVEVPSRELIQFLKQTGLYQRPPRVGSHGDFLRAELSSKPAPSLDEVRRQFKARGVTLSLMTLRAFADQQGLPGAGQRFRRSWKPGQIEAHSDWLRDVLQREPDIDYTELSRRLKDTRGVEISTEGLRSYLVRTGLYESLPRVGPYAERLRQRLLAAPDLALHKLQAELESDGITLRLATLKAFAEAEGLGDPWSVRRFKLAAHADWLREELCRQPDIRYVDLLEKLKEERGIDINKQTLIKQLQRAGLYERPPRIGPHRSLLLQLFGDGQLLTYAEMRAVLRETGISLSLATLKRFARENGLAGRRKNILHPYMAWLAAQWDAHPGLTIAELQARLKEECGVDVEATAVREAMHTLGRVNAIGVPANQRGWITAMLRRDALTASQLCVRLRAERGVAASPDHLDILLKGWGFVRHDATSAWRAPQDREVGDRPNVSAQTDS